MMDGSCSGGFAAWGGHEMVVFATWVVMTWWFRRTTDHDIMVSPLVVIMDDAKVLLCFFRRMRGH
jgi:hypothetical protein